MTDSVAALLDSATARLDEAAGGLLDTAEALGTPIRTLPADALPAAPATGLRVAPVAPTMTGTTAGLGVGSSAPATASDQTPRGPQPAAGGMTFTPPLSGLLEASTAAAERSAPLADAPVRNGEGPAPSSPDVPAPSSAAATATSAFFSVGLAVILGAVALLFAGQTRRFFAGPAFLRPVPFISLLERPG